MPKRVVVALTVLSATVATSSHAQLTDTGQTNPDVDRASPDILFWASGVHELVRGPQHYLEPELGPTTFGAESDVIGSSEATLSLGDGGWITFTFDSAIADGPGADLAVFENGFPFGGGVFMEIGFVEVSTDGSSFARLPAFCRRTTQPAAFDASDPDDFYNLAGNGLGGTGIDLADLVASGDSLVASGDVDVFDIRYVRVRDVVGDIEGPGGTIDHMGRPVADPYPTPFPVGGMDVSGVAVLHSAETVAVASNAPAVASRLRVAPHPVRTDARLTLSVTEAGLVRVEWFDVAGRRVGARTAIAGGAGAWNTTWFARDGAGRALRPGTYLLRVTEGKRIHTRRIVVTR